MLIATESSRRVGMVSPSGSNKFDAGCSSVSNEVDLELGGVSGVALPAGGDFPSKHDATARLPDQNTRDVQFGAILALGVPPSAFERLDEGSLKWCAAHAVRFGPPRIDAAREQVWLDAMDRYIRENLAASSARPAS
jgi:hypothetical protein